jgi:anaphase-promoting complex subunit 1
MLLASLVGPSTTPGTSLLSQQPHASSSHSPSSGRYLSPTGDELVWSSRRLIWSKGVQLHRQYTFEHDEEEISYALFAHFPLETNVLSGEGGKGKQVDIGHSDTFGPFQNSHSAIWGNSTPSPSSSTTGKRKEEGLALVIFLQTRAHIYLPSGEDVRVHLPYLVEKAWSLPEGGVMVERALDKREKRRFDKSSALAGIGSRNGIGKGRRSTALDELGERDLEDEHILRYPRLSVLMGPREELKAVVEGSVHVDGNTYKLGYGEDIDSERSVLFSSGEGYPPFVILHSRKTGQIIFTRRVKVPVLKPEEEPPAPALTPRTMRPSDILAPDPPPTTATGTRPRPSLRRNPSSITTSDRRTSLADPLDRAQRRAPRLSRAALEPHTGPGELTRTLDPPPTMPSTISKGRSTSRVISGIGGGEEKRRESGASVLMREDTDAVARKAWYSGDDGVYGETTMVMGIEREEAVRSEVVLDWIWAWTPPE